MFIVIKRHSQGQNGNLMTRYKEKKVFLTVASATIMKTTLIVITMTVFLTAEGRSRYRGELPISVSKILGVFFLIHISIT